MSKWQWARIIRKIGAVPCVLHKYQTRGNPFSRIAAPHNVCVIYQGKDVDNVIVWE